MKKKALFTVLTASLMCAAAAITFAACGETKTYSVTYVKSTLNETGSVPTDSTKYEEGKEVTVKGKGDLALDNYTFSGWDYNGKTYAEGEKITMPAKDITLTAKWTQIPDTTYTVTFESNVEGITLDCDAIVGHVGDEIDLEEIYEAVNFGSLNPNNYVFSHLADGDHRYYDGSVNPTIPAHDVTFTAYFREIVKEETVTLSATYQDPTEHDGVNADGDVDNFGYWYKEVTVSGLTAGAYTVMVDGDDLQVHADDDPDGPYADSYGPLVVSCEGTSLTLYIMGAQSQTPEFTSYNVDTGEVAGTKETDSISGTVILLKGASHTITFQEDGGMGPRPQSGITYVVEAGEKLPASSVPAAPASTATSISEGWYFEDAPFDVTADIESDITVVSKTTKVTYSNGLYGDGSEEKPVLAADLGQKNGSNLYTITLGDENTFTRDQYTLIGWTVNGMPYNLGDSCDIEAGSDVGIIAVWKLNGNARIEIEDITVGDYATSGTTPQYVYPEKIEPDQKVTVTGNLKNTTTVLATDTVDSNVNMHRFSGVKVMLTDDEYVNTYYAPESYAYAYYDWQNIVAGTITAADFTIVGVRFDGTDVGWFENFCALMTELQTNAGSFKAEIDYTNGAFVYITYTITANFAIGEDAATDHTFLMQYRLKADLEGDGYWLALAGETAELTDITIARLCPHNGLDADNACPGCGATFAYTPVSDTSFTSTTEVIYNGYAVPVALTKGKEIIIYGTQTGAIAANWDSLYWEFDEGYTGRSDCHGWTFGGAKLGANVAGDNADTNTNILYKHFMTIDEDGTISDDWAVYKAIAADCEFVLRAAWVEEGFISVSLIMMSDTAGIYQVDYRLAISDNTVEEFNLHIGGGYTTTTVTAYATITHPAD